MRYPRTCCVTSWRVIARSRGSRRVEDVGRVSSSLEKVKERENENPDQINKVPEQAGDLNSIGEMLGVAFVKLRPDRQPEINEDEHAAEDVQAVQSGDRKVGREIGAVLRQKHVRVFHILFFDRRDLVRGWQRPEMRPIHRGLVGSALTGSSAISYSLMLGSCNASWL